MLICILFECLHCWNTTMDETDNWPIGKRYLWFDCPLFLLSVRYYIQEYIINSIDDFLERNWLFDVLHYRWTLKPDFGIADSTDALLSETITSNKDMFEMNFARHTRSRLIAIGGNNHDRQVNTGVSSSSGHEEKWCSRCSEKSHLKWIQVQFLICLTRNNVLSLTRKC